MSVKDQRFSTEESLKDECASSAHLLHTSLPLSLSRWNTLGKKGVRESS